MLESEERKRFKKSWTLYYDTNQQQKTNKQTKHNKQKIKKKNQLAPGELGARAQLKK